MGNQQRKKKKKQKKKQQPEGSGSQAAGAQDQARLEPPEVKPGRNQPCWCGSGVKYKKCHMPSEQVSERAVKRPKSKPVFFGGQPLKKREPSPEEKWWKEFDRQFEPAPLDQKLEMLRAAVDEAPIFDNEALFEFSDALVRPCWREGRSDDLLAMFDFFEARCPEAFREESHWINTWRVETNLLVGGDVRASLRTLAEDEGTLKNLDSFERTIDRLLYHGRLAESQEALALVLPLMKESEDVGDAACRHFGKRLINLTIERWLDEHPDQGPDELSLEPLSSVIDLEAPHVSAAVELKTRERAGRWEPDDFQPSGDQDELRWNIRRIVQEFAHELHHRHGWSRGRAELIREPMYDLLTKQAEQPQQPPEPRRTKKGKKKPEEEQPADELGPSDVLHPSPPSAYHTLRSRLQIFDPSPHQGAAFVQALPRWSEFLVERELLTEEKRSQLDEAIDSHLELLLEDFMVIGADPALEQELSENYPAISQDLGER